MAKTATRIKSKAQIAVPQNRGEAAADIRQIGDLQREMQRETAYMNDQIAEVTHRFQPKIDLLAEKIKALQEGVQVYCEANREELTNCGKVKTANLVTGEIQWRQRPPSVSVRGAESVIETLKRLGLGRFVRSKEEINKEAILNDPDEVRGVSGISIVTGVEDFVIMPFEQEAAA